MAEGSDSKGNIGGILAGIAAVIVAIGGLIGIIYQHQVQKSVVADPSKTIQEGRSKPNPNHERSPVQPPLVQPITPLIVEQVRPPQPKLVLNDIQQIHDGLFSDTDWSFEVFIDNARFAEIPSYHFTSGEKVVGTGATKIQWTPKVLPANGPYSLRVIGHRKDGALADGVADLSSDPFQVTHINVKHHPEISGSFILDFSVLQDK